WRDLAPEAQRLIAYGEGAKKTYRVHLERTTENAEIEENFVATWPGLCGHVDAWYAKTEDPEWAAILQSVMTHRTCAACQGERLRPDARAATIGDLRMPEFLSLSVGEALAWVEAQIRREALASAVGPVLAEM